MPDFQTIPAEEGALLQKPKASIRRVIVAAAALSFALGAVAAAANDGGIIVPDGAGGDSIERKGHMDLHGSKTNIENVHITHISSGKCLTAKSQGFPKPLPKLNIRPDGIFSQGGSSGGDMAIQFHMAS